MDSVIMIAIGYVVWCCLAFIVARALKIENANNKAISFVYIIAAAPLVLIDYLTGKGVIR